MADTYPPSYVASAAPSAEQEVARRRQGKRYAVHAPTYPGDSISEQGVFATLDQARSFAARFAARPDLRGQDVRITTLDGTPVDSFAGPAR